MAATSRSSPSISRSFPKKPIFIITAAFRLTGAPRREEPPGLGAGGEPGGHSADQLLVPFEMVLERPGDVEKEQDEHRIAQNLVRFRPERVRVPGGGERRHREQAVPAEIR